MDNRPARITKNIIAFRGSSRSIKINFPTGYDLADLSVSFKVDRLPYDLQIIPTTSNITGFTQVEILLSAEQVRLLPNFIDFYLFRGEEAILQGAITPRMGGEDNVPDDGEVYEVILSEGDITVVEIMGLDLVTAQVTIATQKANEASVSAAQSSEWAQVSQDFSASAQSSATTATNAKNQAQAAQTASAQAKSDAEAARDIAIQSRPSRISTFATMLALCVANQPRLFTVASDELQGDTNVPYTWDGAVLLEYGLTPCDTQPVI